MVRRILEFNQWKSSNIIVIHMQKSSHMVSTSLEELGIPFIEIEYEDGLWSYNRWRCIRSK